MLQAQPGWKMTWPVENVELGVPCGRLVQTASAHVMPEILAAVVILLWLLALPKLLIPGRATKAKACSDISSAKRMDHGYIMILALLAQLHNPHLRRRRHGPQPSIVEPVFYFTTSRSWALWLHSVWNGLRRYEP